jgi:3-methylcrotonyl-CoA carboxylase alpha subunit
MFTKILIANRGEIACRVIATARRMGVGTVAVYSDADASALHLQIADQAFRIGPAPVADSYLRGDTIIRAALETGAQAIHPGYGFLSENPDFAAAVAVAGLVFIGPSASAIRAMGLKDAAKALMEKSGVPVVPGYHGANQDNAYLAQQADKIGYPVLIKARAGGGGKGMRLVETPADFLSALQAAQREGLASFGDAAVLIERFITNPRHIEVQIFGDNHGNVVHLFERDCSLQRRHQKVIEEAPAPGMPVDVRAAMGKAAVDAAKAIGYSGAGTVEFIAEGNLRPDGFWFMEMNTRLQVEHPVSEAITGLDFVELQLRVAAGEPLPFGQDDLKINGHAFEARLYAEDVPKGFLPATGRLDHLRFPSGSSFERGSVRIDSGVRQGDLISPWYDPMIAKIITHAPTRTAALAQLNSALTACQVVGCVTNLDFLTALTLHEGFAAGQADTGLIARDLAQLTADAAPALWITAVAMLASLGQLQPRDPADPWAAYANWRHWAPNPLVADLDQRGTRIGGLLTALPGDAWQVHIGDETAEIGVTGTDGQIIVQSGPYREQAEIVETPTRVTVFAHGRAHVFDRIATIEHLAQGQDSGGLVHAPIPGLVKLVAVVKSQFVEKGDILFVLEAMKMEHTLTVPCTGRVAEILAVAGEQVSGGRLLLRLDPTDG